jgi:pentatricopeptide repeat protein
MRPFIAIQPKPKPNCWCMRRCLSTTTPGQQTNHPGNNIKKNTLGTFSRLKTELSSTTGLHIDGLPLSDWRVQRRSQSQSQSRHYSSILSTIAPSNHILGTSSDDRYNRRGLQINHAVYEKYASSSASSIDIGDDDPMSTNGTLPITSPKSESELNAQTYSILDESLTPIGSFTTDTMEEAVKLMEEWTYQRQNSSTNTRIQLQPATQITQLLHRIILENKEGNPQAYFHTAMAESACLYWRNVSPEQCPRQTLQIIGWMQEGGVVEERFMPYNNMISILTKCRNRQAALAVEGLLYRMIALEAEMEKDEKDDDILYTNMDMNMNMNSNCRPDVITYNSAIATWMHIARSEEDAGERAVKILNRMKGGYRMRIGKSKGDWCEEDDMTTVKPNILSFSMAVNTVLRAKKNNITSDAALQAEDLLQDLIYFHRDTWEEEDLKEVKRNFDNVLEALNQYSQYNPEAAKRAIKLLRFMENSKEKDLLPDTKTYNTVVGALAKQGDKSSISYIQDIITEMSRNLDDGKNEEAKVNTQTYNALIKAYVKHGQETSAESILRQMQYEYDQGNHDVRPDSVTWNLVIEGHAKSQNERASHNTANIMDQMLEFGKKHPDVKPDKVTITSMLKSLVRKATKGNQNSGRQAVDILDKMIESYSSGNELMKPDKIIFSTVINCVAKCGRSDAGSEALLLLNRMLKMHKEGYSNLKPDTVTLNTTLSALANTQTAEAAEQAGKLLQAMLKSNDDDMAPNVQSYTLVISAWGKSGAKESTKKIEQLLLEMEKVDDTLKPNTVTYSTVLNAFAKSNDPSSYDSAIRVLKRMEDGLINVVPNAFCYASVMECISKSSDRNSIPSKAMILLRQLSNQSASGRTSKDSYTVVFNTAIKALENSSEKRKDKVAKQFITLMKEGHESGAIKAPLNVRTYNAAIRACAFTKGGDNDKREAFSTAFDTLNELRSAKNASPDLYTYPAMIRASEELLGLSDNDLKQIRSIFIMCCADGLVDALLLKNMVNFLPKGFMRSLLRTEKEPSQVRLNDLPREWKSNIYSNSSDGRRSGKRNNN